ncbi:MAG: hypothetical protein ACRDZR_18855 [Acidimicrobiales bacterium]
MNVVVDDHLLLQVLLGDEPADLRTPGARIFTTGLWYHRLCRAVAQDSVTGAMSRILGRAEPAVAAAAVRDVTGLPDHVGLLSLRDLSWPMARLVTGGSRLNLLSLEALAAADQLAAELCLAPADRNRPLLHAAASSGVPVRLVAP